MRARQVACALLALGCVAWVNLFVWRALSSGRADTPPAPSGPAQQPPPVNSSALTPCSAVDVVYTWVNGSDPQHIEKMRKFTGYPWAGGYRDYGVLKYSMRSVDKYMPWVRDIVLVTDGQVPLWADPHAKGFRVVSHKEIFDRESDLPTFNSNAIEAQLYNIPGVAPCILYMNDDMFLAREIPQDFYFVPGTARLKLYMSKGFVAPMKEKMKINTWHASVGHSNEILNRFYHADNLEYNHNYVGHHCYFMSTDILKLMHERWLPEFKLTTSHRFRERDDTAIPFMQANVALEEFGAVNARALNIFGTWKSSQKDNLEWWEAMWKRQPYCVCLNDGLDDTAASRREIQRLGKLFDMKFPVPSRAERK
eukprot:TRINITY_DN8868_c0_g1_i1.p1 TRINITY_DN8868_c0_g1~~TRINITY_DN8868_c0_g1_i1.p1  ORF type:complete len:366 (-),score=95.11 TRINITY_DN8868_c0_g1_i1:19-1116(-)